MMKNVLHNLFPAIALMVFSITANAQEGLGPFMANDGGQIATAWSNAYGPDAESWITFSRVGSQTFDINYSSSRGTKAIRRIQVEDSATARTLVLGYHPKMPLEMLGTTVLGISSTLLEEIRNNGSASASLIYDANLNSMDGAFTLSDPKAKFSLRLGGKVVEVPALIAIGQFQGRNKQAKGTFVFLNNKNNPVLLEYSISFTGEKIPRAERVVGVTPGEGQRDALEQALSTIGKFRTYGVHFDFDKATIRSTSNALIDDMAETMQNNPLWTLLITGHTDSIGKESYNEKLSRARAKSLKSALVKRGISPDRLTTAGAGASTPVAANKTLEGRALNRRVELQRTDR